MIELLQFLRWRFKNKAIIENVGFFVTTYPTRRRAVEQRLKGTG